MPTTKTGRTLFASALVPAGQTATAAELDLVNPAADSARIMVKITNGATAPTTAPVVQFFTGEASGAKRLLYAVSGELVAGSVTAVTCRYSRADMFANVSLTSGATTGSTFEVFASDVVIS